MKSVPALLLLEWEGRAIGKKTSRRYVLKILHDGGRGLVELGYYEKLANHVEGPGARGEVREPRASGRVANGAIDAWVEPGRQALALPRPFGWVPAWFMTGQ